nr:uncharacterized protein LOC117856369 [Setaria viridis]
MSKPLFLRIVSELSNWDPFFTRRVDATGRDGHSPLQKCTAAIRMLAYGSPADQLDEVLKIAASTSLLCLEKFTQGVIECFGVEYMRPPRSDELEKILQDNESRGFPGMIGSIDCMHWTWKNCPKGWAGMFTRGDKRVPTMILEAVASRDLRIWHVFFGTAGAYNDINVLSKSPLFIEGIKGEAPRVQYIVNGTQYDTGYYLADRIYPEWAAFVKTLSKLYTEKYKLYAQHQEGVRKDVDCVFSVLQSRFDIVKRPAWLCDRRRVPLALPSFLQHAPVVVDLRCPHAQPPRRARRSPLSGPPLPAARLVLPSKTAVNSSRRAILGKPLPETR